jgi:ADP-L-glycero-D-manno-heptose 6-epimerase
MSNKFQGLNLNYKTILITGGSGFIGSQLALHIQNQFPNAHIIIFDCFRTGDRFPNGNLKTFGHFKNISEFNGTVICGDLTCPDDISYLSEYNFDYIFHQAAISDTRVSNQNIIMKVNLNSFYQILKLTKRDNSRLIYASSASTYGSLSAPQTEGLVSPDTPYGFTKNMMDKTAQRFSKENPDIKIVGLRYFNVYGPGEYYKEKTASMVLQLSHQILAGKRPKLFLGSKKYCRDFVHISDVIQANILGCLATTNGVFNVGSGVSRSFYEVTDILCQELGVKLDIDWITNPYNAYQKNTCADITKSQDLLKYKPQKNLESGIKSSIDYINETFGLTAYDT